MPDWQSVFSELAAQEGLLFETHQSLEGLNLDESVVLLAALPPDPGLVALAAAHPQITFLGLGIPELQAGQNLSVILPPQGRDDQLGFVAGYLAAVITPDWRVGVLSDPGTVAGKAARNGFLKGAIFFCGLCRPAYPPFLQYPLAVSLAVGASVEEQTAAIQALKNNAVQTVFVAFPLLDEALAQNLATAGLQVVGLGTPPAVLAERWVASLEFDAAGALREVWPRLMNGEKGLTQAPLLSLMNVNPDLLSPGRQRLVENLIAELVAGYVGSGVDPQSGEPIE